jgi:hypothetical protein
MYGAERHVLVGQKRKGLAGVQFRIVAARVLEAAILIVLHQVVIWIPRKRERTDTECVDPWQPQESKIGVGGREMLGIELDDVMTDQELGAFGEVIQALQGGRKITTLEMEDLPRIRANASELVDPGVLATDLEVDANAARREVAWAEINRLRQRPVAGPGRISDLETSFRSSSLSHPSP